MVGRKAGGDTSAAKNTSAKAKAKVGRPKHIGLVKNDPWLEPFEEAIRGRHEHALWKIGQLTRGGKKSLADFASGHLYFGLHKKTLQLPPFNSYLQKSIWLSMLILSLRSTDCLA